MISLKREKKAIQIIQMTLSAQYVFFKYSIQIKNLESQEQPINGDSDRNDYVLKNFQSGDYLKIQVKMIDEEGFPVDLNYAMENSDIIPDVIANELNRYAIKSIPIGSTIYLSGQTINQIRIYDIEAHSFKFTSLIMTAEPKEKGIFKIYSDDVFHPNPLTNTFDGQPVQVSIEVYFRDCIEGEEYINKTLTSNSFCRPCPLGMYAMKKPDIQQEFYNQCQICPSQAKLCQNNTIILKNGYWRENNKTDQIYKCFNNEQNCIGESANNINYCREGHIGPLCEMCDYSGKVWGKKYSVKNQSYECTICSNSFIKWFQMILPIMIITLYSVFCIDQMIKQSKRSSQIYYLRRMQLVSFGKSEYDDMTTVYLKCMMHYIFLSKVVNKKLQIPNFSESIETFSFPSYGLKNGLSCFHLIFTMDLEFYLIRQIFVLFIFPVIFILFVNLLLIIFKKIPFFILNENFQEFKFIHCIIFIFTFFQPNTLSDIITFISCRRIGDKQFIIDYLSEECYNSHHVKFIIFFSFPLFVIWAIVLPMLLLFRIRKHKKNLESVIPTFLYGFFYKEYRLKTYYWEFVKIYIKLAITMIDAFFKDESIVRCSLVSLIIVLYIYLTLRRNPYKNSYINRQDQMSHLILLLLLIISNIANSGTFEGIVILSQYIVSIIHYTLIADFFRHILREYNKILIIKVLQFFPRLVKNFKCLDSYSSQSRNLVKVFLNWRKVKKRVLQFVKRSHPHDSLSQVMNNQSQIEDGEIPLFKQRSQDQSIQLPQQNGLQKKFSTSSLNFLRMPFDSFSKKNSSTKCNISQISPKGKLRQNSIRYHQSQIASTIYSNNQSPKQTTVTSNQHIPDLDKSPDISSLSNYNFDSIIQFSPSKYSSELKKLQN